MALFQGYGALLSAISAANVGTELSGSGYARAPVSLNYDPVAGTLGISAGSFGPATAAWSQATLFAVFDSLTGGNMLFSIPLNTGAPALASGGTFSMPPRNISFNAATKTALASGTVPVGTQLGILTDPFTNTQNGTFATAGQAPLAISSIGALVASSGTVAIPYASTITPNAGAGSTFSCTLTGNVTLNAITGAITGTRYSIFLQQDATGSRQLTLGTGYKTSGGPPTLSTAANAIDRIDVYFDGTTFWNTVFKTFS